MTEPCIEKKELSFKEKIRRGHFIYFLYCKIYERIMDKKIANTSLEVWIFNKGNGIFPVQSANYRILRALKKEIDLGSKDVFVDVGCGMGRLIGYLRVCKIKGKKTYGIDINREAAEFSKRLFDGSDDVKIIYGDATKVKIKEATVYMVFNPFGGKILKSFLDNVEKIAKRDTRIYYLHAVYEDVFYERRERWELLKRVEIKPRYHLPVILCEFKFRGNKENEILTKS